MAKSPIKKRYYKEAWRKAVGQEMLNLISDKWTLLVMFALEGKGAVRFSDLHRFVGPVSQKMLSQTLRHLEKNGLVTRKVYPRVPPRVEYRLTELGESLGDSTCAIWVWVDKNGKQVEKARKMFHTRRSPAGPAPWQTPAKP
jgi:DNA-binding HxlR family transcriptional regulator